MAAIDAEREGPGNQEDGLAFCQQLGRSRLATTDTRSLLSRYSVFGPFPCLLVRRLPLIGCLARHLYGDHRRHPILVRQAIERGDLLRH